MSNKKILQKFLIVLILLFTTLLASACDLPNINSGGNSGYSPPVTPYPGSGGGSTPEKPKDPFTKIPVHEQSIEMTEQELLGSDFFSSRKNHLEVRDDMRFVNLKKYKTIYIRYEKNLDSEVKKSLDVVISYLQNILKIDPSYKLVYDSGTPGLFDLFCYDTIYIKNPDKRASEYFNNSTALGLAFLSDSGSPVVYVKKSAGDVIIDGKNIKLARILLHEIMHGFGFYHTLSTVDVMAGLQISIQKTSSNKYYYFESGTRNRIYIDDYLFFTNDEIASFIEYLAPNAAFSHKLNFYKAIGGTLPDFDSKFEKMKSDFLSETKNKSVTTKSPDILLSNQIISMKDKTNTFEIVINENNIGTYTAKLSNGIRFSGRAKIMRVSGSRLTDQIICLTDFKYEGQTLDITLYAIRQKDGSFLQRWKVHNEGVNLAFADNTANYFG